MENFLLSSNIQSLFYEWQEIRRLADSYDYFWGNVVFSLEK